MAARMIRPGKSAGEPPNPFHIRRVSEGVPTAAPGRRKIGALPLEIGTETAASIKLSIRSSSNSRGPDPPHHVTQHQQQQRQILKPHCTTIQKEVHYTAMAATADKSKPYFPLAGGADDGWSKEDSATATCFCGAVQLAFPTQGPGLLSTFVCHCTDCRKITASMFASNFSVAGILRIGTVDDFHLHETKLKPRRELYVKGRVGWLSAVEGAEQFEAQRSRQ
jgi:hypothetical protein